MAETVDDGPLPLGPSAVRTRASDWEDLDLQSGRVLLDRFELVRRLGQGGYGAVFEARDLTLQVDRAVKILYPSLVARDEVLDRFRREARVMQGLSHPHIGRVYDYQQDLSAGLAMISMELVPSGSVRDLVAHGLERRRPIPLPLVWVMLRQIAEALTEAHAQGVVHRDVTPGNVLLAGASSRILLEDPEADPGVKLMDFGIAGLLEREQSLPRGHGLGTVAYMAPEVVATGRGSKPADLYGAGAVLYEVVTGELPLGRFDTPSVLRGEVPEELDRLLMALLERKPEDRPTAAELLEHPKLVALGTSTTASGRVLPNARLEDSTPERETPAENVADHPPSPPPSPLPTHLTPPSPPTEQEPMAAAAGLRSTPRIPPPPGEERPGPGRRSKWSRTLLSAASFSSFIVLLWFAWLGGADGERAEEIEAPGRASAQIAPAAEAGGASSPETTDGPSKATKPDQRSPADNSARGAGQVIAEGNFETVAGTLESGPSPSAVPPAEGETPQGSLETNGSGGGLSPSHLPAPDSAPGVTGDPIHGRTGEVQAANPEISTGGNHRVQGAPETAGDEGEPVVSILGPYLRDRIEALERSQEEASHIDEPPEAARARSTARLQIRSNEDGAFVYLGPSSLGATPLQALDVAPRGYLVKAIKEGCGEAARWIDAEAGGSYQIYLDLDCPTKAQTVSLEPAEPRVADSSSQQPRARFEGGEGAGGPARWVSFAGPSTMWLATGLKIPFRYVPPGRFVMGSDSDELGRTSDEVRHDVTLTRGFWVAQTEVTQGTWKALMGYNPSAFPRCGADCPVESVTWYEAVQLANKMSAQAGYPSCYRLIGCDGRYGIHKRCEAVLFSGLDCPGFRLPTEAEWEYAARSLATGALGGSELEDVAWSYYDARGCPQKVGLKAPNTWGLQDMVGNVWEWVWDGWAALDGRAATDPLGPSRAGHQARVYRGGDYLCSESLFGRRTCRAASREQGLPGVRVENIGVRLVRTADPEPGSGRSMSSR